MNVSSFGKLHYLFLPEFEILRDQCVCRANSSEIGSPQLSRDTRQFVASLALVRLHGRHRLSQRLQAYSACSCKGMIKHINQE